MTNEEAKQVLLRAFGCEEKNVAECIDADCRNCQYNYDFEDKLTAMKMAVKRFDIVEQERKVCNPISEEKTLKLIDALSPKRREQVMQDLEEMVHKSLSDLLSSYMDCDCCPIIAYCDERRHMCCESVIYNYLEEDFDDDTNG